MARRADVPMIRPGRRTGLARLSAAIALTLSLAATADGQGRTDVVSLANGDRITGEVMALERGRLEFKTDDAGTLYLEWDKLVSVQSHASGRGGARRRAEVSRQPRFRPQPLHRGRHARGRDGLRRWLT